MATELLKPRFPAWPSNSAPALPDADPHPRPRWLARGVAQGIRAFARAFTGVRATWRGVAPEATPTVYFANHTSHGDFVLLWSVLPAALRARTRPVAAADYWLGSRLRRFIGEQVFQALLIDRERGADTRGPNPVQSMARCLRTGQSLILFPEGTRNTGEARLLPFKGGLFHLAQACPNARLVPVWIDNLGRVLPKGSLVPVPLACSVVFGEPLVRQAGESKAGFLARAEAALLALAETNETAAARG